KALDRLDRTFITPFDREDIHALIGEMDDIVDNIDALAKRFPLFHISAMEPEFQKQADILVGVAPLDVIKWKELYDLIEEAIDGCEDVGNTLERIVLKNG